MESQTFAIKIQEGALTDAEASQLSSLMKKYIEKTGMPPEMGDGSKIAYTLSGCQDNLTECTCSTDD